MSLWWWWTCTPALALGFLSDERAEPSQGRSTSWRPSPIVGSPLPTPRERSSPTRTLRSELRFRNGRSSTGLWFHSRRRTEPKGTLKGMEDKGSELCGFRGLLILQKRFDQFTTSGLLQQYLDVVAPPVIKKDAEVVPGISRWERKVDALATRHNEDLSSKMKVAILLGFLGKEYQD